MSEPQRWLSVEQAAAYLQVDEDWIMMHVRSGALKKVETAVRKRADGPGRRRYRIDRLKLDALMERLETGVEPARLESAPSAPRRVPRVHVEETMQEWAKREGF